MKKIVFTITTLSILLLVACANSQTTNQSENNEYVVIQSTDFFTFEEALNSSTDVVVAQLVERRYFGSCMVELEFVISEQIFGNAPEHIFVYLDKIMRGSFRVYDIEFEMGIDYLLLLERLDSSNIISNFHEDGYFLAVGAPVIDLNNPMKSMLNNESIIDHSVSLDFSLSSLSREQIISFAYEMTKNNPLTPYFGDFIRTNCIEKIVNNSPAILVVEINELINSIDNCTRALERYRVTVIEVLSGGLIIYYEFEIEFFMDTVRTGEQHIIAIGVDVFGPKTYHLTSRNSVFSIEQLDEVISILD